MKKAILYGIGNFFRYRKYLLPKDIQIVAYGNSSENKASSQSGKLIDGIPILSPKEIEKAEYDILVICTDVAISDEIFVKLRAYDIDPTKIRLLYREHPLMYSNELKEWEYKINKDWSISTKIGDLRLLERWGTDFITISEVFYANSYYVRMQQDTVVIDMGMNVGYATLYFAGMKEVRAVYGFEPFPDTYRRAVENIELNPVYIKNKITAYNEAIADKNEERKVSVVTDHMGWRGINDKSKDAPQIGIKCRSADEAVGEIIERHKNCHLLLKIDTEGSEFPIFESLDKCRRFETIDTIVMEYHANPRQLIDTLNKYGFLYTVNGTISGGMITAFNIRRW